MQTRGNCLENLNIMRWRIQWEKWLLSFAFFDWLRKKKKGANDLLSVFRAKELLLCLRAVLDRVELYNRFEEQWRQLSYLREDCCGSLRGDS